MGARALPLWLGPTSYIYGGKSAAPIASGTAAAPSSARGGAPERTAKRGAASGLQVRGRALDALAGNGGVGRERVALSPVDPFIDTSFRDRGKCCVSAKVLQSDPSVS